MKKKQEIELELAWLVKHLPKDYKESKSTNIRQAYLDTSETSVKDVRVRDKDGVFTRTVKTFMKSSEETGFTKEETEKISKSEFESLWKKSVKRVRKVRYFYPLNNTLTVEIDIYKDNLEGLVVVEVEFPSISACEMFKPPKWFEKEVTDSEGIYPPVIANMTMKEVDRINNEYKQKPHNFE